MGEGGSRGNLWRAPKWGEPQQRSKQVEIRMEHSEETGDWRLETDVIF
jgi:hypothetical protein